MGLNGVAKLFVSRLGSVAVLLLVSFNGFAQCDPLMTPYAENNSQDGIMFDIQAISTVTINQFSANLCDVGPYDMEIYFKAGTHVGFTTNAGAWTLIGSTAGLASAGPDVPTLIPIAVNIPIPAGQTFAFYVTESANTGNNMCYTNGVSLPLPSPQVPVLADANIIVFEGTGKDYAFGNDYYPRSANFTIDYDCCPLPTVVSTPNSCSGMPDGTVEITGAGAGPWIYQIADINGVIETSPPTNGPYTFLGLIEGQYAVTATDNGGCIAAETVDIIPTSTLALVSVITNNLCYGGTDGELNIDINGGSAPFDIAWTDAIGTILQVDVANAGSSTLAGLAAGDYLVGAQDQNGCTVVGMMTVTEPAAPLVLDLTPQDLSCFQSADGEILVSQSGVAPFSYELFDVLGNPIENATGSAAYTFDDLEVGVYFVTVIDAQGCETTDNIEVFEPAAIQVQTASTPVLCFNGDEATAEITQILGGTAPFVTTWNDPNTQTGALATGLISGMYIATVTDASGCSVEAEFEFDNPPPLSLIPSYLTDTCGQGRGAAIITAGLGTPPYTYLWKPDSIQLAIHTDLYEGAYEVVVTDVNGCKDSTFVEVSDDIPYPIAAFSYRIEGENQIDQEVQFINNSIGTDQWTWNFGDGESSHLEDPRHHYDREGDYLVQLLASNGFCVDTVYDYVNIDPLLAVYVPNAFTPGINGKNDYFFPQGEGIELESYDMSIFNRWGNLVWETGNFSKKWDGTNMFTLEPVPVGTYVYLIKFREFADLDRHVYKGIVTVIRD